MRISRVVGEEDPVRSVDVDSNMHLEPSITNRSDLPSVSNEPEKSCLRSNQELRSRQFRSCTKVHMQRIAVGRAVDLTRLGGYEDLLLKFEEMFEIEGELCGAENKWQAVYTDDEDDMMKVGDDPWHESCCIVQKIFIYTQDEVKKLSLKIKLLDYEEIKLPVGSEAISENEHQLSVVETTRSTQICP